MIKNKKLSAIILVVIVAAFMGVYYTSAGYTKPVTGTALTQSSITKADVYTCPMHPEVTSDKPGQCPKCGMDLVLKTDDKNEDNGKSMNKDCMDKCKDKGCNMDDCKGMSGGCKDCSANSSDCKMMKDKDCSKSGCMKHN